jgi:sarcosine oxidase subunit delta
MYISCPYCGPRDLREFSIKGTDTYLSRPESTDWSAEWDDYLHLRENPAGPVRELWQHSGGCSAWLVVARDTRTHEIAAVTPAREAAR